MQDPKLSTMDHLSTKSSVFHPTQLGAGGQQEIFRHMKRHYDRLGRVTAATDSSPPKSYKTSTLARDREKKHHVVDTFKLPVTSKFIEEHIQRQSQHSEMISLQTKDSDIQSILRHVPELRKNIKFKSKSETSLGTNELEVMADGKPEKEEVIPKKEKEILPREDKEVVLREEIPLTSRSLKTPLTPRTPLRNSEYRSNIVGTTEHDMEMKYLTFVSDITREILTSSISSDRALNMLFERHLNLNKGNLNESIMRMRVEELKIKLAIKS
ncbi:spermatogenesis-associated protein 7 homolog [Bolinopsis microptera]|uniref:spermatogenesis-associated protein 7 homolog n=1 Tax=Bolinopsis microptera TaxID=2820187 RepID=UPI00307928D3